MLRTLATLLVLGCSSTVTVSPDAAAPTDAPATDAPATDGPVTDVPAADAGPVVRCGGADPTFPMFDQRCAADADCVLAVHQTNCCGDHAALGIHRAERARFDAAEALCRPMFPACGCPTRGTLADDGQWSQSPDALRVACRAGRCTTSVAAAPDCPGVTCGAGQLCARGCCGVPGCTPPPSRCVTVPPSCEGRPSCGCLGASACPTGSCVGVEGSAVVCLCA